MLHMRTVVLGLVAIVALLVVVPEEGRASPKYYFKVTNIHTRDNKIIPIAKETLEKEVAARPEFVMDRGNAGGEDEELTELQKKGLKGVQVSMRIDTLKVAIKPPSPGKRDKQMSIDVKVSIFGHTIPGNKVLFTGNGDASLVGDFSERLQEKEQARFTKTALESAIKQAVSTAVIKLGTTKLEDKGPPKRRKRRSK